MVLLKLVSFKQVIVIINSPTLNEGWGDTSR